MYVYIYRRNGGGARGSGVGRGTMLQARRSRGRFPMSFLDFSIELILMAVGPTQPLREMSTRNPGGKRRPKRKADLTAICEPIV
jgi:hypothetical protein